MALHSNDLFVIQSQDDSQLYKLKLGDLDAYLEASTGIQFRGSVDLNNGALAQTPPVTLPATNGDLYLVEADAATINSDWIMEGGAGVGTAAENDRIIWDADSGYWVLVSGGSNTGGTLTGITATDPLQSDGDTVNPVLTIDQATTTEPGAVARLATQDDVKHTDGTGATDAVVTANLLKATNDIVEGIVASAGGVVTVTYANSDTNNAILIPDTSGAVTLDVKNSTASVWGVVQIADATDITNGVAGAGAVVDASQLKVVTDSIDALETGVSSVTTTDANGNGALAISPEQGDVAIEIATATDAAYGVVQLASTSDITNGTAGAGAVVTAEQLKAAIENLPSDALQSITEGGDGTVAGALQITTDVDGAVTIGVIEQVFAPYDFSSLTDITA